MDSPVFLYGQVTNELNSYISSLISSWRRGSIGVLEIASTVPVASLTLRSLVNARDDFLLATLPVADLTRPAPGPIVFPQVAAAGGGYKTEIILISPGSATIVPTVRFFDSSGRQH